MLLVEIDNEEVVRQEIQSKKDGRLMNIYKQTAWVHLSNSSYPKDIVLLFFEQEYKGSYEKGIYILSDTSFFVGEFQKLSLRKPVLKRWDEFKPVLEELKKKADLKEAFYKEESLKKGSSVYAKASNGG